MKPFYLIAHRVLTVTGARAALEHGANAIEIDLRADEAGWWAQHTPLPGARGDRAEDVFEAVAQGKKDGNNVLFVWFDIKNPTFYKGDSPESSPSSMEALQDLGRRILQPAGIKVLYGFYRTETTEAYRMVARSLNSNEAVALDGNVKDVISSFNTYGPHEKAKRIFDRGLLNVNLQAPMGDVAESTILQDLTAAQQSGMFGKVFGWTVLKDQHDVIDAILGDAEVDGIIAGMSINCYEDIETTRMVMGEVQSWIRNHPDKYRLATQEDKLFE